jgi:hypothetical protein
VAQDLKARRAPINGFLDRRSRTNRAEPLIMPGARRCQAVSQSPAPPLRPRNTPMQRGIGSAAAAIGLPDAYEAQE